MNESVDRSDPAENPSTAQPAAAKSNGASGNGPQSRPDRWADWGLAALKVGAAALTVPASAGDPAGSDGEDGRPETLDFPEIRLRELRERRARAVAAQNVSVLVALLAIVGTLTAYVFFGNTYLLVGGLAYGAFLLAARFLTSTHQLDVDIQFSSDDLELRKYGDGLTPAVQRAEKFFKSHQTQLRRYYDQTLTQSRWIFGAGLLCIVAGFVVVGTALGFVVASNSPSNSLSEKVVTAALGGAGGVLANFIAVIYLRMFKGTMDALNGFHTRLVATHHLHFANFLAAKIDDELVRRDTLADMAKTLAAHAGAEATRAKDAATDGQG